MKQQHKKAGFWILYHLGLLVFSIVAGMLMKYKQTGNFLHPTVIVASSNIFVMSACIGYLAIFMVNKSKKYNQSQLNKRIIPALLIFYLASFLIANLSVTAGVFGWFIYLGRNLSEFWPHLFKNELTFANWRFFMWLMFFTIGFFYVLWLKSTRKEQKLREENLKFRYRNLKSQVNPHFLFNSLNTLSEIIYKDTKRADHFIQKLSGIYRYILENEEIDLVPLNQEIDFLDRYFSLQKERGDEKIFLNIDIQDPNEYKIIPVSLQLLIENAIKHNSASKEKILNIDIELENNFVVVSNNLQRKNSLENSIQTGLSNLKERVKLITGEEMEILEENNRFIVKLPVLHYQK